jgi:hypothetical protein
LFVKQKNINSTLLIILFISFFSAVSFSQEIDEQILGRIGDNILFKSEYENRLNFSPQEGIQDKSSSEGIKNQLLYTILAEKLWANYALESGYDNHISVVTARNVTEKMFIRDEFYRREIKDKIEIFDDEMRDAEIKYNNLVEIMIFYSEEEKPLFELRNIITNNQIVNPSLIEIDSNIINSKTITISFGDLPERVEEIVSNLDIGEYSSPIEMESVWNIFYVKDITERSYKDLEDRAKSIKKISKILKQRKENNIYETFHKDFFKNKRVDADGTLFKLIAKNLSIIFNEKYQAGIFNNNDEGESVILFDSEDVRTIEKRISEDILNKQFIRFNENPIDVITFLREISFISFSVESPDCEAVKIKLNKKVKEYIKHELLARAGIKSGLNSATDVQRWVKIWYENYLYQAIRNDYIKNRYKQNSDLTNYENIESNYETPLDVVDKSGFQKFVDKTIELSERYPIEIDDKLFASINQGNINLFVLRNLGFGGTIAAVPSSPPFMDWYLKKQKLSFENL